MKIVAISDTHLRHNFTVPDGDIIIHAGDACIYGHSNEIKKFSNWYSSLPHKHKIYIAGNHDKLFESQNDIARGLLEDNIIYLQDSEVVIDGIKIYGSPWQPEFCDWAFNLPRGRAIREKWSKIPKDTNILVTHGPPHGACDLLMEGGRVGCEDLADYIKKIKPKYHICGHIHWAHGIAKLGDTQIINAAICDESYEPTNDAIVFEY